MQSEPSSPRGSGVRVVLPPMANPSTAADEELLRLCELRLQDARKVMARAGTQVQAIGRVVGEKPAARLSGLGAALCGKPKPYPMTDCKECKTQIPKEALHCFKCGKSTFVPPPEKKVDLSMWVLVKDSAGRPYYWNQEDDSTSWTPPKGWESRPSSPAPSIAASITTTASAAGRAKEAEDQEDDYKSDFTDEGEMEPSDNSMEFGEDPELQKELQKETTQKDAPRGDTARRRHSRISEDFSLIGETSLNLTTPAKSTGWKATFRMVALLGLGAFGSVHLIEKLSTKQTFAIKAVNRTQTDDKQRRLFEDQLANERRSFSRITDHRFLLTLHQSFDEDDVSFMIFEACLGGDLSFHMCKGRRFTEHSTQFYGACMVLALEHLHAKALVHSDVKPENVCLDTNGYPKLIDYGNCKDLSNGYVKTDLGTLEYCAPEIVNRRPHGTQVDVWALAVLVCELSSGICPFEGGPRGSARDRILTGEMVFTGCSAELTSLLRIMLDRDPNTRATLKDVRAHRWFKGVDWEGLAEKRIPAPFIPVVESNKDFSNFAVMKHTECTVCDGFSPKA